MSVLKRGSKGEDVRNLQTNLNQLGYGLSVDGDYGPGTEEAVKHLQTAFGYDVDGQAGDATLFLVKQQIGYSWNKNNAK